MSRNPRRSNERYARGLKVCEPQCAKDEGTETCKMEGGGGEVDNVES